MRGLIQAVPEARFQRFQWATRGCYAADLADRRVEKCGVQCSPLGCWGTETAFAVVSGCNHDCAHS